MDPRYERFAQLLRSSPHNLMAPGALQELEARHLPEAREFAAILGLEHDVRTIIDIGSGGGIPGIPIAMELPDHNVHLVESRQKKAIFLRETADELEIPVEVHRARIEELIADLDVDAACIITARAVAPLAKLVDWTIPALRRGARLYAIKGDRFHVERAEAASTIRAGGLATTVIEPDPERLAPRVVIVHRG